jgi:hypothetical protein
VGMLATKLLTFLVQQIYRDSQIDSYIPQTSQSLSPQRCDKSMGVQRLLLSLFRACPLWGHSNAFFTRRDSNFFRSNDRHDYLLFSFAYQCNAFLLMEKWLTSRSISLLTPAFSSQTLKYVFCIQKRRQIAPVTSRSEQIRLPAFRDLQILWLHSVGIDTQYENRNVDI